MPGGRLLSRVSRGGGASAGPGATARRGVLTLVSGTAAGQVIAVAAAPVLSRIYTPADLGVLAVVTAVAASLATVMALRLELAVPLPEEDSRAYALVHAGLAAIVVSTAVGTVLLLLLDEHVAAAVGAPDLVPWLAAAPTVGAAFAAFALLNGLAVRARRYPAIARRNVVQAVTTSLAQIGLGLAGLRPGGLVVGLGAGQAVGAASLLVGSGLRGPAARAGRSWRAVRDAVVRYRRFPLLLGPSGLLNTLGIFLPLLLLAAEYGPDVAGWLGLTQRVLAAPVALLGTAVAQVYLGELSRAVRGGSHVARELFRAATLRLAAVGAVLAVALLVAGPAAFRLVFGPSWEVSGQFAQALAVSLAAQLVAAPLSQTLVVHERQGLQLTWDVTRLVLTSGAVVVVAALGGGPLAAAWALGAASAGAYAVSWALSRAVLAGRA